MATMIRNGGTGPGARTVDGCSVDFWKQLKPGPEPDIVAAAVPAGGSILELGAGVGRITHPLLPRGYRVTAVDNSPEMLAEIRGAETVLADIEDLALDRQFDAVLMGSCLIHAPGFETRHALLATCRRHLAPDGQVLIQRHDPSWLDRAQPGFAWEADGVRNQVDAVVREDTLVRMTLRHTIGAETWTHCFTTEQIDFSDIEQALTAADLRFARFVDVRETWIVAKTA
ncbi:methyltransferase [Aliidongia dinghuensis]|uniref:Methyltransferase n=1 Tax=Aliidongia dinghuensis TaxID=1867774 RepID=A0A8J3E2U8_9PROT|nr:class I SAM-dependent methyltransferase [Aliidongia dinghuensis]GGF13879.1 methyltransferase [Aliidongia dinghuensis]